MLTLHYILARLHKEAGNTAEYISELKEALNNHDSLTVSIKQLKLEYEAVQ